MQLKTWKSTIDRLKFHLIDSEHLDKYEDTKNNSELMASLFGQEPASNVYKFEITEDDKIRIKKKNGFER